MCVISGADITDNMTMEKIKKTLEYQIYFVAKNTSHHFHGNTKDLSVLYFFGGSEY